MSSKQGVRGVSNGAFSIPAPDTLTEIPLGPPLDSKGQELEQPPACTPPPGTEQEQEEDYGPGCGWHFCFSGSCVRHSRTAKWLLFWMCWAAAVQGMVVNGFVNVSITTIEKRFNLKSRSTGIIASSYDVASLLVVVPVSYLGSRPGASKPRWLGLGLILMGLGSFTFLLPHFAVPPYEGKPTGVNGSDLRHLCHDQDFADNDCDSSADGSWLSNFLYVFILGQFLQGLGATPIYTLGMVFIDESVSPRQSSFYIGIFSAMAVVGPAIGYGLGGQFLKNYIDAPAVDPALLGLTPTSDRWLGGWWMGFFLSGSLSILVAIPILLIPAIIPRKNDPNAERQISADSTDAFDGAGTARASAFKHLDGFCTSSKKLLTNITFLFLSLAEATEGFLVSGMAAFMPKLLERQFGMQASLAAMIVGAVAVSAGGGGTFLGGWVIKKFSMTCTSVIRLSFALSTLCTAVLFFFFVSCPDIDFAGVNTPYDSLSSLSLANTTSSCNAACSCSDVPFSPVCGANNIIYFSPCHAGCSQKTTSGDKEIYSSCACVELISTPDEKGTSVLRESLLSHQATPNTCLNECPYLPLFIFAITILMFATFFISMLSVSGTLRCVESDNRGLALGLQAISFRVIGSIPGPLLFGIAIDQACTLWGDTCGVQGACVAYDNTSLSRYMFAICFTIKVISTVSYFLAWRKYAKVETLEVSLNRGVASISTSVQGWPKNDQNKRDGGGHDNPALDVT